jgi:tetraacyldisaccharide 4'-kinase
MRMSAQAWFNRIWYGGGAPPWWLMPWSQAYRGIAATRRFLYRRGFVSSVRLRCPVIVVGNLSVGGTGKTPLVIWLVARLRALGYVPGIVTRGFGGSAKAAQLIDAGQDPAMAGDEPLVLARRSGARVAVGRDRPAAARLLVDAGCDLIVSDDGLQHYKLARDCEIVVVDGARQLGNGWPLPAGPLREPPARLAEVDAIVVNGGRIAQPGAVSMHLAAQDAIALGSGGTRPLSTFAGTAVHAVAGIGNPQRFFDMLRAQGIEVIPHALDDHARITGADISFADLKPVLMTEKDAVKCKKLADDRHWYIPVDVVFDEADATKLMEIVTMKINDRKPKADEVEHG